MPEEKDLLALELTREDRTILRALIDGSLTAAKLAERAKAPVEALTKREREILEKAARLLGGTRDASSLKMPVNQLNVLEALLRESSSRLAKYPGIAGRAGRAAKEAAGKLSQPLYEAFEKYMPDLRSNPQAAPTLAQQMKGLYSRLKRFREGLEVQIRIKDEPEPPKAPKKR